MTYNHIELYNLGNKDKPLPTRARLNELLDWDPAKNRLIWKVPRGNRTKGSEAGHEDIEGQVWVGVDGYLYQQELLVDIIEGRIEL